MNLRTSFVLMLLFMGLGSVAFLDPFGWEEKKLREEEGEKQVFSFKEKIVHEITIRRDGREVKLACVSAEGCQPDGEADWKMVAPVEDLGDSSTITTLVNAAFNLRAVEKVPLDAPMDNKEFGFGQGLPALEMRTKEGILQVETGSPTAVGPNVYLRKPGDEQTVYIVASFFPQMLDKDPFHWRNKRLFPGMVSDSITAISWKGRKLSMSAKKEEGKWRIEAPIKAPGNFIMLEGLANTLAYATAKSIPEKDRGGKPSLEIEFTGGRLSLSPTPNSKELLASTGGKSYLVDPTPFERFHKGILEYRERRLFPDLTDVAEFELEFPRLSKKVKLKRDGEWKAVEGDALAEPLSQERIRQIAQAFGNAEASAFLPASNPGAAQFKRHKPDVVVILPDGRRASFLVAERKMALTEGFLPGEVKAFSGGFLSLLPIRPEDLYASHNKIAPQIEKEEDGHHHSHQH